MLSSNDNVPAPNDLLTFKLFGWTTSKNKLLFHKVYSVKEIANKLNLNDFLLVCDLDVLFQKNPFLMFEEFPGNDFYYTHCLMSGPESKREEKIWKDCNNKVNGGVWGLNINSFPPNR